MDQLPFHLKSIYLKQLNANDLDDLLDCIEDALREGWCMTTSTIAEHNNPTKPRIATILWCPDDIAGGGYILPEEIIPRLPERFEFTATGTKQ